MLPVPSISAGAGTPKNTLAAMFGVKKYPTSRVGVVAFPIRTLEPGRGAPARVMFGAFSSTKTSVAFTVTAHRFSFGESCAEARSEERRVGKECDGTGRSRWSPDP